MRGERGAFPLLNLKKLAKNQIYTASSPIHLKAEVCTGMKLKPMEGSHSWLQDQNDHIYYHLHTVTEIDYHTHGFTERAVLSPHSRTVLVLIPSCVEFVCSPHVFVTFSWDFWAPLTVQRHALA